MKNIWFDWADDLFRPFGAGLFVGRSSVGFTHGYSSCSPPANPVLQTTVNWKDRPDALRLCVFAPLR
jgi:hypothetical protein